MKIPFSRWKSRFVGLTHMFMLGFVLVGALSGVAPNADAAKNAAGKNNEPRTILTYWFANRDEGTRLFIYEDNTVKHFEYRMGTGVRPHVTEEIREPSLTRSEREQLDRWIKASIPAHSEFRKGETTLRWSKQGKLIVGDGFVSAELYQVEPAMSYGGKDRITVNLKPEAREIYDWVMDRFELRFVMPWRD